MNTEQKNIRLNKHDTDFSYKITSPTRHLNLSSSSQNKILSSRETTNKLIHSNKVLKQGLTIKIPQLLNFSELNTSKKLSRHKRKIKSQDIDRLINNTEDTSGDANSKSTNLNKFKSSSNASQNKTNTNTKYEISNVSNKSANDNNEINKLILANINPRKRHQIKILISKSNLKRYSILDKLLFKITKPEEVIEEYYRNNDIKPSDKYALFRRQLVKERHRMTDILNDIKKTQSMNESMLKVYMSKLKYSKIKAMTVNMYKGSHLSCEHNFN